MYDKNDLENLFQNNFNLIMLLTVSDLFDFSKGIFYLIELCKVNVSKLIKVLDTSPLVPPKKVVMNWSHSLIGVHQYLC